MFKPPSLKDARKKKEGNTLENNLPLSKATKHLNKYI